MHFLKLIKYILLSLTLILTVSTSYSQDDYEDQGYQDEQVEESYDEQEEPDDPYAREDREEAEDEAVSNSNGAFGLDDEQQEVEPVKAAANDEEGFSKEDEEQFEEVEGVLDASPVAIVEKILKPFKKLSDEKVQELLTNKAAEHPLWKYAADNETIMVFATKMVMDDDALPQLAGMLDDRENIIMYILLNIGLVIFGFLLNTMVRRKENEDGHFARKSIVVLINLTGYVVLFIMFFGENVAPTWDVFKGVFF